MSRIDTLIIRVRELLTAMGDNAPGSETIAPHLAAPRSNLQAALADLELAKAQTEEESAPSETQETATLIVDAALRWSYAKQLQSEIHERWTSGGNAVSAAQHDLDRANRDASVAAYELMLHQAVLMFLESLTNEQKREAREELEAPAPMEQLEPKSSSIYQALLGA